jgi:hypothetical protein
MKFMMLFAIFVASKITDADPSGYANAPNSPFVMVYLGVLPWPWQQAAPVFVLLY